MSNCEYQRQCSVYHKNNYECGIEPMGCALYPIFKRITERFETEQLDLEKKVEGAKNKLVPVYAYRVCDAIVYLE